MAIFTHFCPAAKEDPETEAAAEELWQSLSVTQRKLLLQFEDKLNAQRRRIKIRKTAHDIRFFYLVNEKRRRAIHRAMCVTFLYRTYNDA